MKFIYVPIVALVSEEKVDEKYTEEYWLEEIGLDEVPEEYRKQPEKEEDMIAITARIEVSTIQSYYTTKKKIKGKYLTNIYTTIDTYSTFLSSDELDKLLSSVNVEFYGNKEWKL